MRRYGESKRTRIMMATVSHVTSGLGLRKSQADGFLFDTSVRELRNWDSGLEPGTFTCLHIGSPHHSVAICHGVMAALRSLYHLQQTRRCDCNVSCSRCGHIWLHVSYRQFSPFTFLLHLLSFSMLFPLTFYSNGIDTSRSYLIKHSAVGRDGNDEEHE
jgi:hypothetical protein